MIARLLDSPQRGGRGFLSSMEPEVINFTFTKMQNVQNFSFKNLSFEFEILSFSIYIFLSLFFSVLKKYVTFKSPKNLVSCTTAIVSKKFNYCIIKSVFLTALTGTYELLLFLKIDPRVLAIIEKSY